MRGLYAIVDTDSLHARGVDPVAYAEALLEARPAAIQLRDKQGSARTTLALLREIAFLARRAGVPFFGNDRPDLALAAGCDGVHVGQEDVPVSAVRLLASRAHGREGLSPLRVGLSTHDRPQLEQALEERPDYIAIGPIFGTQSKADASPVVGLEELAARVKIVRERAPGLPIVAIGGITRRTAAQVGALVDAVAVIGALLPPDAGSWFFLAARDRARALSEAIVGGPS